VRKSAAKVEIGGRWQEEKNRERLRARVRLGRRVRLRERLRVGITPAGTEDIQQEPGN
jgi:hypothetical protein